MPASVTAPSGEQFVIASEGYRAVVTESGGALRTLTYDGRDLVDGFAEDEMSWGGRGQLLVPWPNRVRDGRYSFGGEDLQLALTEPTRHNASHGLARWATWHPVEHSADTLTLALRIQAQTGYPWTLQLHVTYAVGPSGLTVTQSAENLSARPAPYASGAHPYLSAGAGPIDGWQLTCPASVRALTDPDRLLPTGSEDVAGTAYDFRDPRPIGDAQVNHAFTGLATDDQGVATTTLLDPATGSGVALWVDRHHRWLMLFSADDAPGARRSLAVEPMTANADAFNSGVDLVTLEPGATFAASWGIRAVG